jgi:O-antigen/teichoic acid export membrane protein
MQIKQYLKQLFVKYYQNSIVLKRFSKVFSLDVLVRASNFFLLPVYLKLMTKDEFGLYGYLYSMIWMLSLILNFGFYVSQTKMYHDYDAERKKHLIFTIMTSLSVMLIIVVLPIYASGFDYYLIKILFTHPIPYSEYRGFFLLAFIVATFSFMCTNFFITSENIKHLQIFNFLKLVLVNSVVIYALSGNKVDTVKTRLEYSYLVELFIILLFVPFYIKNMKPVFDFQMLRKAFKIGIPSLLISVVGLVNNFSDKFILEKYGNFSDLAIYNLAFTIASIIGVVFASFHSVYLPFFYKEKNYKKNFLKTKQIVKKMGGIFILLGVVIWIGIYIILKMNIIDNNKYGEVIYILPFLLLSQNILSITQLFINYIVYFEVVYVGSIVVTILCLFNVGMNMLFIPSYKYYGASISALLVSVISMIIYYQYTVWKGKKEVSVI